MLSPGLTRFIIDPENMSGEPDNTKMISLEKQVLMLSPIDHEKVLNDYHGLNRVLNMLCKAANFITVKASVRD